MLLSLFTWLSEIIKGTPAIALIGAFIWGMLRASLKTLVKPMMARHFEAKKRSLQVVNEHFEQLCNAASVALVGF